MTRNTTRRLRAPILRSPIGGLQQTFQARDLTLGTIPQRTEEYQAGYRFRAYRRPTFTLIARFKDLAEAAAWLKAAYPEVQ